MPQKTVKKKRKLNKALGGKVFSIVLIVIAIGIFINVGKQVYNVYSLKVQAEVAQEELTKLQDENATLTSTKEKLEDPDYVATYARGEYMFSKGDEKVFYLPSDTSSTSEETSQ